MSTNWSILTPIQLLVSQETVELRKNTPSVNAHETQN